MSSILRDLRNALKIRRVLALFVLSILIISYVVYASISIYRGYETYSRVSIDKAYYDFIMYRNRTLIISYLINLSGEASQQYVLTSPDRIDCSVNQDKNTSTYNVFCIGNPEIIRKIFVGQGSRPYFSIVSLMDIFYNITSERNVSSLGTRSLEIYVKEMRIYIPTRLVAVYNVSLEEGYIMIYSDIVSGTPIKIDVVTRDLRAEIVLIGFTLL